MSLAMIVGSPSSLVFPNQDLKWSLDGSLAGACCMSTAILRHLHQIEPDQGQHFQKDLAMLNKHMGSMLKSHQAWSATHPPAQIKIQSASNNFTQHSKTAFGLLLGNIHTNPPWNHQFFIFLDTFPLHSPKLNSVEFRETVDREIDAWNYLRGVLKRGSIPLNYVEELLIPLTKTANRLDVESGWPANLNKHSYLTVPAVVELLVDSYFRSQPKAKNSLEECLVLTHPHHQIFGLTPNFFLTCFFLSNESFFVVYLLRELIQSGKAIRNSALNGLWAIKRRPYSSKNKVTSFTL
ncbi:uncharacterized protein VP01_163g3 [Puccinia sorghi]|uniref:Uncharacterized protein n=1 Tax=Puccinia sorghi TaxID=27349 RepID=A0A0L6VGT0_9BASI|nr:uncharacterized protein VP01_163g3 [Puccinia sorghi]